MSRDMLLLLRLLILSCSQCYFLCPLPIFGWIRICMQELIDSLDDDLRYAIEVEGKLAMGDVENYEEVRDAIRASLEGLRDTPNREECPLIYHLDVAAMYPNIILTNRCAARHSLENVLSGSDYLVAGNVL